MQKQGMKYHAAYYLSNVIGNWPPSLELNYYLYNLNVFLD